jgi:hypothetical protein
MPPLKLQPQQQQTSKLPRQCLFVIFVTVALGAAYMHASSLVDGKKTQMCKFSVPRSNHVVFVMSAVSAAVATQKERLLRVKKTADAPSGDIAVIIPWFQTVPFLRPLANLALTYHQLRSENVPVFVAEVALDDQPFKFLDYENAMHFRTNSILWHKENLFREAVKRLPPQYTKVVMVDKDVTFDNPHWLEETSKLLDEVDVVQPFMTVCRRNIAFKCVQKTPGFVYMVNNGCDPEETARTGRTTCGLPGYAMAFHRDFVEQVGIMEENIIGGGDKAFMDAALGIPLDIIARRRKLFLESTSVPYEEYRLKVQQYFNRKIRLGYLPNVTALHFYHGPESDRQYSTRTKPLSSGEFSTKDLYKNADGMWELKDPEKWRDVFQQFFENRNEDAA